jgi:hypothetical protein
MPGHSEGGQSHPMALHLRRTHGLLSKEVLPTPHTGSVRDEFVNTEAAGQLGSQGGAEAMWPLNWPYDRKTIRAGVAELV